MSPLSPKPAQTKRMHKRRATMMSTFKTYCEINTQTIPLEGQPRIESPKRSTRNSSLSNIEMDKLEIDTIDDEDEETSGNTSKRSTKGEQASRNSKNSRIASKVHPSSEIVSNVNESSKQPMNSEMNTLIGTWNPESSSKRSTRNSSSKRSTRNSSLNNIEINNSAIDTIDQDEETSKNRTSKLSTTTDQTLNESFKQPMNSEIHTLIETSSQVSSSKRSTRNSSANNIEMNNSAIDTIDDQGEETTSNSTISKRSTKDESQVIENSEIVSKVNPSSEIISNVDSKLSTTTDPISNDQSFRQPMNSEIKTLNGTSNQESSSANSFKSASNVFNGVDSLEDKDKNSAIVTANCSEIISSESENLEYESVDNSNEDHSSKPNNSEINTNVDHSSVKANSEIFSNYITELDDTFTNGESEKNRNSVKSTIPDLSIDYEVNEEFSSMGKHLNDDKYSKIEDDDEVQHSSDQQSSEQHSSEQQEESSNEIVDDEDDDQIETTKQSDLTSRSTFKEKTLSELENTSFSRIEANCSRISVSFEPSINNSIEKNHLEDGNRNDSEIVSEDEQQLDGEFKVPRPPKKQIRIRQPDAAIVKKQSKYYETMINKTPTIIYPDNAMNNDEDDEDASIRRSNRIRVRPLEYWRNQKLKYKLDTETKCFTIDGVEKGFKPENPFSKKYTRQPKSNKRKLKQKKTKLPRIKEEDSDEEEEASTSNEDESSSEEEREPIKRVRYSPNDEESIHQDINESAIMRSERIKREATEFYSKSDLKWNPASQSKGVFLALMNRKKSSKSGTQASGFIKMIVSSRWTFIQFHLMKSFVSN